MSPWNPRSESPKSRARRTASLTLLRTGIAGLARLQRTRPGDSSAVALGRDAAWTTARILAANLVVLCVLGAVTTLVSDLLGHLTQQAFAVLFAVLSLVLIRRGSQLRRRGLERLGRSITAWAGFTGCLVVVSVVLALGLSQFVPELLAVAAGWLLVLGIWKDLAVLVTAAVAAVVPIAWGAFVWHRSLVGAVLILAAAGMFARTGTVYRRLFAALVASGLLVVMVSVHQLTHAYGAAFDGSDLLALTVVLTCLVAASETESWRADWAVYAAIIRATASAAAILLAALAAVPGRVESWVASTPTAALARVMFAGILVMVAVWVSVSSRPVAPGGRLKVAAWSVVVMVLLGALIHAYSAAACRWLAIGALTVWGFHTVRSGLRRSRRWNVVAGFGVVFGATLPVVAPGYGLVPVALLLLAVAGLGTGVLMTSRPEDPPAAGVADRYGSRVALSGVR